MVHQTNAPAKGRIISTRQCGSGRRVVGAGEEREGKGGEGDAPRLLQGPFGRERRRACKVKRVEESCGRQERRGGRRDRVRRRTREDGAQVRGGERVAVARPCAGPIGDLGDSVV
jgi:hypothetical protein